MPALEHEMFLGRECVAGDDGRLTWLVLAAGYRTVHQASAQADSMFPDSWAAFVKQRVRWSRNSYRAYLTALAQGWLWRQPLITQVTVLQILVTPLTMGAAVYYTAAWATSGGAVGGRDRARLGGRSAAALRGLVPPAGEPPRRRDRPADGARRRRSSRCRSRSGPRSR